MQKILIKEGFSLLEVIIAMAIFALVAVSMVSLILGGTELLREGTRLTRASAHALEGVEASRVIKNRAWNELSYDQSAVSSNDGQWRFLGEGTTEQTDEFLRVINFLPVYRNDQNDIVLVSDVGAWLDIFSRYLQVTISWQSERGISKSRQWDSFFTNWQTLDLVQTDWSGGDGQNVWLDESRYKLDDGAIDITSPGEIKLAKVSSSSYYTLASMESSDFFVSDVSAFNALSWEADTPDQCTDCQVLLQIKTADDISGAPGTWSATWSGPDGEDGDESDYFTQAIGELVSIDHNQDEWIKYKMDLVGEAGYTPVVTEIKINYSL